MKNSNRSRPTVGERIMMDGDRWPTLRGDWSKPPKRTFPEIKRLCIYWADGFVGSNTEFLGLFPSLRIVRLSPNVPVDFCGLYNLKELQELWMQAGWFSPQKLQVLDLSRIPTLRRLTSPYFGNLCGLGNLRRLTHLSLDHVYGVKSLDLRPHRRLKVLALGPANGVNEVCLDGLASLCSLTLACMRNLTSITGTEFYDSVTKLDIRSSPKIPKAVLGRFRGLKQVTIGTKSTITPDNFPLCSPTIRHFPV